MKSFLLKKWSHLVGALFLGLTLFAVFASPKVLATETNPIMAQTDYRRNAEYIRVYNEDAVNHGAGSILIYTLPASVGTGGTAGLSVSTTTTANVVRIAGVVPAGETLLANKYGRLQVHGYHPLVKIAVANTGGDVLVTSTTAEKAGVFTIATSSTTVGADFGVFGVTLETTTSSTTVKCLLKIE